MAEGLIPESETGSAGTAVDRPFVVGVGASAGGLEALERLFKNMPPDSGLAFVVIQHLSPDFRSLMDELLARHTQMAIHRVEDGMAVEANSIYLIPPKKEMIVSEGRLLLTDKDPERDLSLPIDHFFRSLAQDIGSCSVAVVLSGTGSDGSRGIRDVHEAGGLVISQDEATAKFDGMPKSARDTGIVDLVLAPEEMPQAILDHVKRIRSDSCAYLPHLESAALGGYDAIFKLLRDEYGIDFSHYKPNTVTRRIQRRLSINQLADLDSYVGQLETDPVELNSLYRDLLIGVTRFFRDRDAFELLEHKVLPELLAAMRPDQEIRVWCAGCATGEEPYSLAIMLHERLQMLGRPINVKIFASDVHKSSLEYASNGIYHEDALAEVTPARLNRYFIKRPEGYQVVNELRQMIVFARHNIIKDSPFTKLDLISCRNLLIYLQPPAQKKALSLFHFGLRTGGVLFLGPSETPGELSVEFESLDDHWRVYRKRRDVRLPPDMRLPLSTVSMPVRPQAPSMQPTFDNQLLSTYDRLLDEYMPPGLLLTDNRQLVHTFGDAGRFLRHRAGRPTSDVLDQLEGDLKMALAGAIQRAAKEQAPVSYSGIRAATDDGQEQVAVAVRPIHNRHGNLTHFFIALESLGEVAAQAQTPAAMDADEASRQHVNSLETELRYTRENLQATIEELETSNEELQASNEELVASNEELQSTNEELHSVNEELYTVNAEYQNKIVELTELTDDMDNLLRSTDIGTIFLDRNLCIRKFTPQIGRAFDLLPQDVGRKIDSFSYNIQHANLLDDVRQVLDSGQPIEKEVQDRAGAWFFLRILPYKSHSQLDGVVLSLIDVSPLKQAESELRTVSAIVASSEDAIVGMQLDGVISTWNQGAARLFGYVAAEALGRHASMLHVERDGQSSSELIHDALERAHAGELAEFRVDVTSRRKDGTAMDVQIAFSPIHSAGGTLAGISLIARDITQQKDAERELARRAAELEAKNAALAAEVKRRQAAESEAQGQVEKRDQFLAMLSHELRNPLAAVLNSASLLEWEQIDRDTMDAARGIITRQSQQMARLLDDLLDVSRITQGKIEIRRRVVDLAETSRHAVEAVRPQLESRNLTLGVSLPAGNVSVTGDAARLQQIQVNLLTNAVKYTPPGGRIWLNLAVEGEHAVLRVRDTGIGIPWQMREKIFDLFVQVDDTPGKIDGGMGVGLTLVRTLVKLHGGDIHVESAGAGQGSEFTIRLPLSQSPAAGAPMGNGAPHLDGLRVVLVEDHADVRLVTGRLLKSAGCQVTNAVDGASGILAITQQQPDLALVDIGLPDMEGYEVARRIRESVGVKVKLLALTGFGQPDDRRKALEAGFNDHLVKPVEYETLVSMIRSTSQDNHDGKLPASGS